MAGRIIRVGKYLCRQSSKYRACSDCHTPRRSASESFAIKARMWPLAQTPPQTRHSTSRDDRMHPLELGGACELRSGRVGEHVVTENTLLRSVPVVLDPHGDDTRRHHNTHSLVASSSRRKALDCRYSPILSIAQRCRTNCDQDRCLDFRPTWCCSA